MPVPELSLTEEQVGLDERTVDWHLGQAGRSLKHASDLNEHVDGSKQ
jgi:hypothetical protein